MSIRLNPAVRYMLGHYLSVRLVARPIRNRLYGGSYGLRMICLHRTDRRQMEQLRYLVDYTQSRFEMASPDTAAELIEGRSSQPLRDQVLFSFDDGFADNYDAATFLNQRGIRAIFFVIPSFLGRSVTEFYSFHREQGVNAAPILLRNRNCEGLSLTQVREMIAMGHLIAAHNYSHRSLGKWTDPPDLEYEIGRAITDLSDLLGHPCMDFAFGYGRADHLSAQAAEYLKEHKIRTYSCIRGLNVAGRTARFLGRDHLTFEFPKNFVRAILKGALDDHWVCQRQSMERLGGLLPASPNADSVPVHEGHFRTKA